MPPSGTYSTITLTQWITSLAARLGDPNLIHWVPDELEAYLTETLRTWNALTGTFKGTATFNTNDAALNTNTPFFDLPTVAPGLRGMTVTTDQALAVLAFWLLEPPPLAGVWTGTDQFSLADLTHALERRRDQFLLDTAAVVSRTTLPIAPPPDGRVGIPESVVTVRRFAWQTPEGLITPLQREDEWSANAYSPSWVQNPVPVPRMFSMAVEAPLVVQLLPPPSDSGTLDLCYVPRGASLGTGVLIGVPDDWVWVVLFGALADLLGRDGLAFDPQRAQYAEARWQHGLTLARVAPVALTCRIGNQVVRIATLPDLDQYRRTWQTTQAAPKTLATLGQTMAVLVPPPDANAPSGYSVTVDLVRNAPIPVGPAGYLQVGPEVFDTLLDYGQHLALLKEGPTELVSAQALLDRFFRAAGVVTGWQAALQLQRAALQAQTANDKRGASPVNHPVDPASQVAVSGGPF